MKNFTLLFAIIFTISMYSYAQLDEFKLSDYKLPDIKRHQLDLKFDLNGNMRIRDQFTEKSYYDSYSGSGMFMPEYRFYRNSRRYQGNQVARFDLDYHSGKSENEHEFGTGNILYENRKSKAFVMGIDLMSQNRLYLQNEITYLEFDLNLHVGYDKRSNENNNTGDIIIGPTYYDLKHKSNLFMIELPLYFGFGRVEQIQDSRHALYILKDLKKKGRLKRIPDNDEIIELAEKISQVKNKRFFDSRLQKIDELDTVNGFLNGHELIDSNDITYFSSLNDMWDFGGTPIRLSGIRGYFGLVPMFGSYFSQYDRISEQNDIEESSEGNETNNALKLLLVVGFDYYKPIKQKWQYNLTTRFGLGPTAYVNDSEHNPGPTREQKINPMEYFSSIETGFGFYPNTRTYFTLSILGTLKYCNGKENEELGTDQSEYTAYSIWSGFNAYYYISPKLRLSGTIGLYIDYIDGYNYIISTYEEVPFLQSQHNNWFIVNSDYKTREILGNFSITFTYSIF